MLILDTRETTQINDTRSPLVLPLLDPSDYFSRYSVCMKYFKYDAPEKSQKGLKRAHRKALCRSWPKGAGFSWSYVQSLETLKELDDLLYDFISGRVTPYDELFTAALPQPHYHAPIKLTPKQHWAMRANVIRWMVGKGYEMSVLRDFSCGPNGLNIDVTKNGSCVIFLGMLADGSTHS